MKILFVLLLPCVALALNNGLALTPQMGFNTWNHFHCNISETLIRATADALVSSGLASMGYTYLNLDDCWAKGRFPNGTVFPDPVAFPSGMAALGDYIRSKGLKFGIYTDLGTKTCAGRPGSLGYEKIDAETYASWGVSYVKVDNCFSGTISPKVRYPVMRDALNATGSPIFYSMCEWGLDAPWLWAKDVGNSWRTTGDISDSWDSMTHILDLQTDITKYAGPGGWNDMDMLEVGNGGMTFDEYKAHFSLWSLLKSPLLIGADITKMTNDTQTILFAREVIAVNQDALGVSGSLRVHHPVEQWQIWAGPLEDGSTAFVLFNRGPSTRSISVNFSKDLGVQCPPAGCSVRCLWFRKTFSQKYTTFTIPVNSHGVFMGRVFA